jgi:hypothetical protein
LASGSLIYQAALLLVLFMGIYGLLDAAFSADWPAWVLAPIAVIGLWAAISLIADIEAD